MKYTMRKEKQVKRLTYMKNMNEKIKGRVTLSKTSTTGPPAT